MKGFHHRDTETQRKANQNLNPNDVLRERELIRRFLSFGFLCVSVSLMKLLAIRLSCQNTAAKSLVMW